MERRVLVLCTGNSARSQMAEGLLRQLGQGEIEVFSAGTAPSAVHPLAVRVMEEIEIDISLHRSKDLDEFRYSSFDDVITVCDNAAESCPIFPGGARRTHWGLPDPAAVRGDEGERLAAFRRIREDLESRIRRWLQQ
jgi:arsenate reductase